MWPGRKQLIRAHQPGEGRIFATVAVATVVAQVFNDFGILGLPLSLISAYTIAFLITYWISPRPPFSYREYVVRIATYMSCAHAGLWAVPQLLNRIISKPFAYGLPVFALVLVSYWFEPFYPTSKQLRFGIWILLSIGVATVYGWTMRAG
jgi:hypothetical protein